MMLLGKIGGSIRLHVVSADTEGMLQQLSDAGVILFDVVSISPLSVRLLFARKYYKTVQRVLANRGERIEHVQITGVIPKIEKTRRRPVLITGCLVIMLLTCFLPRRVLFIEVEGNENIPAKRILEGAMECGIHFGTKRSVVRSEKVKNELQSVISDLQWVGINTRGCVATIHVREREERMGHEKSIPHIGSVVASRDGIIQDYAVLNGTPLCQKGQAVKEGDVLISGLSKEGLLLEATRAEGEVMAQTVRQLQLLHPITTTKRGPTRQVCSKYSVLIGKKLINFYKDSGICNASCAKIYEEKFLTLPGGFELPVALITETWMCFENDTAACCADNSDWLHHVAEEYLVHQMIAGQVIGKDVSVNRTEDLYMMTGEYTCTEMIGRIQNEENLLNYGEYYRENR